MRVKRFVAPDMAQALKLVRQALGPDAVILATGKLKDGQVEVSAAVDDTSAASAAPAAATTGRAAPADVILTDLARRVDDLGEGLRRHLVMTEAAARFAARPEVAPIYDHLAGQEVAPAVIAELMDGLFAADGRGLLPRLAIRLKKLLSVTGPPRLKTGVPALWALVGPTGVGKTTTLAKLAATFALKNRLRVGMITVDTFRMAAAEQLMVYGRIMEMPTLVAGSRTEFAQAVVQMAGLDLVLVDTVGRSPMDEASLDELAELLAAAPGLTAHLVLACPTREADQEKVLAGFARFRPQSLIFTKLDETATYGPILNRVRTSGLPVSYLAMGQKVPDDLEEATREGLARRLLPLRRDPELAQGTDD